jgi:hypothetical protein
MVALMLQVSRPHPGLSIFIALKTNFNTRTHNPNPEQYYAQKTL